MNNREIVSLAKLLNAYMMRLELVLVAVILNIIITATFGIVVVT